MPLRNWAFCMCRGGLWSKESTGAIVSVQCFVDLEALPVWTSRSVPITASWSPSSFRTAQYIYFIPTVWHKLSSPWCYLGIRGIFKPFLSFLRSGVLLAWGLSLPLGVHCSRERERQFEWSASKMYPAFSVSIQGSHSVPSCISTAPREFC